MPLAFTFADFTPGEASEVTGIHPDTLRTWRKRGAIAPHQGGRPSFTCLEVAALMIQRTLTGLGTSAAEARTLAEAHAQKVVFAVLMANSRLCVISVPQEREAEVQIKAGTHELFSEAVGMGKLSPEAVLLLPQNGDPKVLDVLREDNIIGIPGGSFVNFLALAEQFAQRTPHSILTVTWESQE